ncbi:transcription factor MYB1R1-like [Malania oleifera]|uniref:transcription factor MYB1R1-like n=1 Tax=Malania oleifera TaxID=397392 RepID=UPI0025AE8BAB|nr:transcription factor MYB1R1-like [Malania oleifera]
MRQSSSTCSTLRGGTSGDAGGGVMLFGVRVVEGDSFGKRNIKKKRASKNGILRLEQRHDFGAGIAARSPSDDGAAASDGRRERKRGLIPWTEEEHGLFLLGMQKLGRGKWTGISRTFVKTRTPGQISSHAQYYFRWLNNCDGRRGRRNRIYDSAAEEEEKKGQRQTESTTSPLELTLGVGRFHTLCRSKEEKKGTAPHMILFGGSSTGRFSLA